MVTDLLVPGFVLAALLWLPAMALLFLFLEGAA